MKKISVLVLCLICLLTLTPNSVSAETLQDYIDKVDKYTNELQEKKDKIALNDEEIEKIKTEIGEIQEKMKQNKSDQETLQEQIKKNNEEIKAKEKETKSLIHYAQVSSGENEYLEYIFGADSLTDMIYRISLVEQISKYNDKVISTLNKLIEDNKIKKEELAKKTEELKQLEKELEEKQEQISAENEEIRSGMPTVEQQIEEAQKMVDFYRNKGCSASDVIGVDCAVIKPATSSYSYANNSGGENSISSTGAFVRPIMNGYVTSGFGNRSLGDFHYGIDMSSDNTYNTKVYPIASGMIYFVGYDMYGAKIVRIAHNYNGKIVGSTYVHLASFAPGIYEGMEVGVNDYIGIMGETGYAFGVHLHLEVSDCPYLYAGSACYGWYSYTEHIASTWQNPADYINFPSEWYDR